MRMCVGAVFTIDIRKLEIINFYILSSFKINVDIRELTVYKTILCYLNAY